MIRIAIPLIVVMALLVACGGKNNGATALPPASGDASATAQRHETERQFTGSEAAAAVDARENSRYLSQSLQTNLGFRFDVSNCEALDFNESQRAWIIECTETVTFESVPIDDCCRQVTYRFFDESDEYELVR